MGWPSTFTYHEIVAFNVPRSVAVLAHYGDVAAAEALFAANPALADDPDALASAAGNGHAGFVRLLLHHQPHLAQRVAVAASTRELTEFLFDHGMDPNRPDWLRITPLHRFAEQGNVEKAAIFIDHGADLHARDEELSSTPLGYAARAGKRVMIEFLLRRGAKPALPDDPPWATPLAWATRRRHDAIVRLLTEYEQSGALPARRRGQFEALALDLVDAYRSGDDEPLRRVAEHFHVARKLTWDRPSRSVRVDRLRRYVRERLGRSRDATTEGDTLALADAHLLIARSYGFGNWSQLLKHVEDAG